MRKICLSTSSVTVIAPGNSGNVGGGGKSGSFGSFNSGSCGNVGKSGGEGITGIVGIVIGGRLKFTSSAKRGNFGIVSGAAWNCTSGQTILSPARTLLTSTIKSGNFGIGIIGGRGITTKILST